MKIELELTPAGEKMLLRVAGQYDGNADTALEEIAKKIFSEALKAKFLQTIEGGKSHG